MKGYHINALMNDPRQMRRRRLTRAYPLAAAGLAYGVQKGYDYMYPPSPKKKGRKKATKTNKKLTRDVNQLRGKVIKLKQMDDATTGSLTYRDNYTTQIDSSANKQVTSDVFRINDLTAIETVLAQTKYFNPLIPGTLTVGSSVAGTYQRNILIESASIKLKLKNNYQTRCKVIVYLCKVKDDTSIAPGTLWHNAVPDGSNLTNSTDLNQYPSDYNIVKDIYTLKKLKDCELQPGQICMVSHSTSSYNYDSATTDSHNLAYQKEYKASFLMVVLKGCLAHDSVESDEQGITQASLDCEANVVYKVKYSAGINLSYTHVINDYNTPTTGFVVSNKPISGQQAYSV